ncbi:MAG: hypothetical protein EP343_26450 [Deltaproteobacteria bacterium]|nr:MAG: hypothetical protein EP343_26450 [Deltaproteobacteria bacterium]
MKWLFRLGSLIGLGLLVGMGSVACTGSSDVGKECPLTLEASKKNLQELGNEARIVEPSFDCEFTYCIANYYDANNPDKGYCTRICNAVTDCPDSTNYVCEPFIQVEQLPDDYKGLAELVGQKLCLKVPPSQNQQTNQ